MGNFFYYSKFGFFDGVENHDTIYKLWHSI